MNLDCTRCLKPTSLCVCESIEPLKTRLHILILQHPQEPDKDLGSARLAHLSLPNSTLKVGLSWPNLTKALGQTVDPKRWGVLYLGSGVKTQTRLAPGLHFVTKQGALDPKPPKTQEMEGLIVLDGTWSQAKALWWRNAWLLKTRRVVLVPSQKSLYKELRREPRGECLSTIESIAESLTAWGESPKTGEGLRKLFEQLLDKKREELKALRRPREKAPQEPVKAE